MKVFYFQPYPVSANESCDEAAEAAAHNAGTDLQPLQKSQIKRHIP